MSRLERCCVCPLCGAIVSNDGPSWDENFGSPDASGEVIPAYSVRGVEALDGGRGRAYPRGELGRRGVPKMADRIATDHDHAPRAMASIVAGS